MDKYKEEIKEFLKKGNKTKIKFGILTLVSMIFSMFLDVFIFKKLYGFISIDRFIILFGAIYFIGMHFILKLADMYNFIYKKRYLLAGLLLLFLVVMGYSGSSITNFDLYIQGSISDDDYKPILGTARMIRSDEWAVNTPLSFAQNKGENKLSYFNLNLRGTETDMFTIINSPVLDITSIGKLFNIGYLFGNRIGLSFWWYGRLIALLLVSFELCMVITKNKKLVSLIGALLLTFSPAVQWWYSNFIADLLIIGSLAIVLIDKFMRSKKDWIRYLCVTGIAILAVSYVFVFYPAWQIPFAYVYLALFIFVAIKNRKEYKINKKDIIAIVIAVIFVVAILLRYFLLSKDILNAVLNTDYPGQRTDIGGGESAKTTLFSYVYGMYLPFYSMSNPCETSSMISLYPIPMLVAIIFMIRNKNIKEHYKFLIPMLAVATLFSIWCLVSTNTLFAKLTLLSMSTARRVVIPLGFSQILLMIYLIGNIKNEEKILTKKTSIALSVILTTVVMMIAIKTMPENYMGALQSYVSGIMLLFEFYFLFTINKEESKKHLMGILAVVALLSGVCVNPIVKGIDVMYEKPLSKEITKIVKEEPEALWVVENDSFLVANYVAAQGTKIINSTNYYPNVELMEAIFDKKASDEEFRKKYNRYAHILIKITDDDSDIELLNADVIRLSLNVENLKKLNVKYICATRDLEKFSTEDIQFEKVYYEDSYYIYKLNY